MWSSASVAHLLQGLTCLCAQGELFTLSFRPLWNQPGRSGRTNPNIDNVDTDVGIGINRLHWEQYRFVLRYSLNGVNKYLWFTKELCPNSAMGFNKLIIHGRKKTNKSKAHTSSFRFSNLLKKFPIIKTYNISDSGTGLLWTFELSQILQCRTALQSCHSAFWDRHNFLSYYFLFFRPSSVKPWAGCAKKCQCNSRFWNTPTSLSGTNNLFFLTLGLFKLGHIVTQGFNATVLKHRRACMCVFLNVYSVMWFSMLYLTQGINLVSRVWPVINFYSSAHSALALTTSNYVAGRSCHHKESHTFGWYDSLPLYYTQGHTEEDSFVSLTPTFWETIQTFNMKRMHGCKVGKLNTKDNFGFKHHIIRSMN